MIMGVFYDWGQQKNAKFAILNIYLIQKDITTRSECMIYVK